MCMRLSKLIRAIRGRQPLRGAAACRLCQQDEPARSDLARRIPSATAIAVAAVPRPAASAALPVWLGPIAAAITADEAAAASAAVARRMEPATGDAGYGDGAGTAELQLGAAAAAS